MVVTSKLSVVVETVTDVEPSVANGMFKRTSPGWDVFLKRREEGGGVGL